MALSSCIPKIDAQGREMVSHGTPGFPVACYQDDLRQTAVPWHWHEEWEWILAVQGNMTICLEKSRLPLRQGESVFLNAGVLHGVQPAPNGPSVLRSLVFQPRLLGGSLDSLFWQKLVLPFQQDTAPRYVHLTPDAPWQQESIQCLAAAWEAITGEAEDFENLVRYQLSRGVSLLCRHLSMTSHALSAREQAAAERIKAMLRFIQEHFSEELTLEQIAASASVSESSCLRCFRQMLGTTPIQYLRHFRLEKAAELLRSTGQTAGEAAAACGFSDLSYFTRLFREAKGVTPGEYRHQDHKSISV